MRDFLRRGRPHVSTIDVGTLLARHVRARGPSATATRHRHRDRCAGRRAADPRRPRCSCSKSCSTSSRNAMEAIAGAGAARRAHPVGAARRRVGRASRFASCRQRPRHRRRAGRPPVRSADDFEDRTVSASDFRSAPRSSKRMAGASGSNRASRGDRVPLLAAADSPSPDDAGHGAHRLRDRRPGIRPPRARRDAERLRLQGRDATSWPTLSSTRSIAAARLRRRRRPHAGHGRNRARARARPPQDRRCRSCSSRGMPTCRWRWPASRRAPRISSRSRSTTRSWSPRSTAGSRACSNSRASRARGEALEAQFARLTPRQVEIFDLVRSGFTSQAIAVEAGDQHPHGRKLPRGDHGEDAGRERRRAGAAGHPARPHHPVELPPDRCGWRVRTDRSPMCAGPNVSRPDGASPQTEHAMFERRTCEVRPRSCSARFRPHITLAALTVLAAAPPSLCRLALRSARRGPAPHAV